VWSFPLNLSLLVRAATVAAICVAGAFLAGCNSDEISLANNAKANQPVPPKLVADIAAKDMDLQSPILIRLFKQEAELEVWKQDRSGQFSLLKTYPICRWSGDLGPKIREGDRQAPEGFYSISPAQMNPQSAYYLSFNTGFPNAFDKALGRTGSELMVHGDCSSRGCYAMTDEQIAEIYALGRESFFGGQRAFQLQAYPFRMTPVNMAKHRNNPNMPFWKMIKEGYDHFEVTRHEPKVDFCEKKYVFDAAKSPNATREPVFDASAKCPAYVIPDEIADAVREKQQADEAATASLIAKGTPVARLNTGIDGGMNRVFASKLSNGNTGLSESSDGPSLDLFARAPGTIPATVNPPRASNGTSVATNISTPATRVASAGPAEGFGSLIRRLGGSADTTASAAATSTVAPKPRADIKRAEAPARPPAPGPKIAAAKTDSKPGVKSEPTQASGAGLKPSISDNVGAPSAPAVSTGLVAGSQPIMSSASFDSRFSAVK